MRRGCLMREHDAPLVGFESAQGNESLALPLGAIRQDILLNTEIHRRLGIPPQYTLAKPGVEILRRPGVAVVVRSIAWFVLAVDQAHDIVGVPLIIDVALLPGDDIIGRRQKSEKVLD